MSKPTYRAVEDSAKPADHNPRTLKVVAERKSAEQSAKDNEATLIQQLWQSDKASSLTNQAARKMENLVARMGMYQTLAQDLLTHPDKISFPWVPYFDDDLKKWRVGGLEFPGSDNYAIGPFDREDQARNAARKANNHTPGDVPSVSELLEIIRSNVPRWHNARQGYSGTKNMTDISFDPSRHVPPTSGPQAAIIDALFDLITFIPQDTPAQFTTLREETCAEPGDENCAFFTERYLYPLLGKEDARSVLVRLERVFEAMGYGPSAVRYLMQDEMVRRWIGTVRVTFMEPTQAQIFLDHMRSDQGHRKLAETLMRSGDPDYVRFGQISWDQRTQIESLVQNFGDGALEDEKYRYRSVWHYDHSFLPSSKSYARTKTNSI